MFDVIYDRIFWIYVAVILFITIIGVHMIITNIKVNTLSLLIIWLMINVALLITIYCAVNIQCYTSTGIRNVNTRFGGEMIRNPFFITINVIFAILLVSSLVFIDRMHDITDVAIFAVMLTLLGGFVITHMVMCDTIGLLSSVAYLILWLILILYVLCGSMKRG